MARRLIDGAAARRLYDRGWSDPAIAAVIGCTRRGITHWRNRQRLPANRQRGGRAGVPPLTVEAEAEVAALLRAGQGSDWSIGRRYGVSDGTIALRRRRLGLPPYTRPPLLTAEQEEAIARRLAQIEPAKYIAPAFGVSTWTIAQRRQRLGLPAAPRKAWVAEKPSPE